MSDHDKVMIIFYIAACVICLVIFYYIIQGAVSTAMKKQNKLIDKQNDILLKMLNQMGVDKDELTEIFLTEKQALWPSMKNKE